jgi:hypothetical protein
LWDKNHLLPFLIKKVPLQDQRTLLSQLQCQSPKVRILIPISLLSEMLIIWATNMREFYGIYLPQYISRWAVWNLLERINPTKTLAHLLSELLTKLLKTSVSKSSRSFRVEIHVHYWWVTLLFLKIGCRQIKGIGLHCIKGLEDPQIRTCKETKCAFSLHIIWPTQLSKPPKKWSLVAPSGSTHTKTSPPIVEAVPSKWSKIDLNQKRIMVLNGRV